MKKAILFFFLILVLSFTYMHEATALKNNKAAAPKAGVRAPDFSVRYFNGKPFTLSKNAKNKNVLLWFTNLCPGCQSKLPLIEKIDKEFRNKGMEVLAVSQLGGDRKTVEDAIRKNNLSVKFLYDPSGEITTKYAGEYHHGTCPLTNILLINKSGKIAFASHFPGISEKELTDQINQLIKGGEEK